MPRTRSTLMGSSSAALLLSLVAGSAHAQVREWAAPVSSTWNTAANWTAMDVPNMPGESALIDVMGTYTVTAPFALSVDIDALQIGEPGATVALDGGATFAFGSVTNVGTIIINSNSSSIDAAVTFSASGPLDGAGTLVMNRPGPDAQLNTAMGATITHASTHTIRGWGQINGSLINNGQVTADILNNDLFLRQEDKTNNGTMAAINGSFLTMESIEIDNASGTLRGDDGTVRVGGGQAASILGGDIVTTGTGRFDVLFASVASLTDVSIDGDTNIVGGGRINVLGSGLTNEGTLIVNSNSSSSDAFLVFAESGTLDGAGTLVMNRPGPDAQLNTAMGATITHASTHTIRGWGQINGSLINNGQVTADILNNDLFLRQEDKTNNGTMAAINGSFLTMESIEIDNASGTLRGDDGTVRVGGGQAASILGGDIVTTGTGRFDVLFASVASLTDVSIDGDTNIVGGGRINVLGSGLTNEGTLIVNSNSSSSDAFLVFAESGTLDGAGTLVMNRPGPDAQLNTAMGATITHASTHTIRGWGQINGSLINNGQVTADILNNDLFLQGEDKTNNGTMTATNSAFLTMRDVAITQSPAGRIVADGGTIVVDQGFDATIAGGTIDTQNGDFRIDFAGVATLDGVVIDGGASIIGGGRLDIASGGMTATGTINVNSSLSSSDAIVNFAADATIGGTGTIQLTRPAFDSQLASVLGVTGRTGPDMTVTGIGVITGTLDLGGTLAPGAAAGDVTGTLRGDGGDITLLPTHTFECEIEGAAVSQYDRLQAAFVGEIAVGGALHVALLGGYVPALGSEFRVIEGINVSGTFDSFTAPALPAPLVWKVIYRPAIVSLHATCPADLTTDGSSDGVPDGAVTLSDFSFYLSLWSAGNPDADVTTDGSSNGIPDGLVTLSDFSFYLSQWSSGCP